MSCNAGEQHDQMSKQMTPYLFSGVIVFFYGLGFVIDKINLVSRLIFFLFVTYLTPYTMLPNEERLKLQVLFRPLTDADKVIESELIKVNQSIDRKWAILDDFSASWTWTQWKNFKDSLYGEISYREYLIILQSELK